MALGADAGAVRSMVLSQGLRLTGMAVALGMVAALALGSVLRSVLFEIRRGIR